jgi:microcystin-dependent protein
MSQPFLGMLALFPYNFAPRGWAFCNGQILPITQNTALFSLLGTTFGGNGQTTFALPDLRGRVPIHSGTGPGLSNYDLGQVGGSETVTLTVNNMPIHTHVITMSDLKATMQVHNGPGDKRSAAGNVLANEAAGVTAVYSSDTSSLVSMAGAALSVPQDSKTGPVGNNTPFDQRQPYLAVNFCIALEGIFPSRN